MHLLTPTLLIALAAALPQLPQPSPPTMEYCGYYYQTHPDKPTHKNDPDAPAIHYSGVLGGGKTCTPFAEGAEVGAPDTTVMVVAFILDKPGHLPTCQWCDIYTASDCSDASWVRRVNYNEFEYTRPIEFTELMITESYPELGQKNGFAWTISQGGFFRC